LAPSGKGQREFCHNGHGLLYVFSSNAQPFQDKTGYSLFTAFALLNHSGDFAEAAKALAQQGYGDRDGYGSQVTVRVA
jgi:hypothetical protein